MKIRLENELPESTEKWGWKFHHIGIPTNIIMPGERYLPHLKFFVSGFSESPFGVEWMRFEEGCNMHKLIKTVPHIAFEVADIDRQISLHNLKVITEPNSPAEGTRVAIIEHNGAPVELIEFFNKR